MRGGAGSGNRPYRPSGVQAPERLGQVIKLADGNVHRTHPGNARLVKRLAVVAEDSLIVEAIGLALRKSGEFNLVAHLDARTAGVPEIVAAMPEVVLIDELDRSEQTLGLIREIKLADEEITVIVLTLSPESAQLDELFEAGATAAVSKATHPQALATLIRETIDGRMLHPHKSAGAAPGMPVATGALESVLSGRELEVLRLVAAGSSNSEIARKLWVTEQTVKFHLSNIYRKLDVANRTEASRYAHVNGLLNGGGSAAAH
jgi:DNA-binding NarL/FixJ family response regulator